MGNTLTKLLNAGLFILRGMLMSPTARMRQDQEFKSEQQAKITSAVEYLSVTGSLIFKDGRYVGMMTAKNDNKETYFFVTQFIRPDTSPAKALTWMDMSLTCGALTLERNASRKNQITLHDDVEAENEPRPRDTCMSYQDWFVAEMKAVEKELMKGDVVEVAKRFGLGTIIARPISAINLELDAGRIDDALPVIAEPELLSKCSLKDSSNVTRQDKRIPVYYVSPLWPLLPQKYQPPEGFVLPFGPLKERVLDYLIEMAQDCLDKSKPIPFPPPSLLNLEKGKVFQPKSALKVSSTVSPRSKKLVASGKNDLGLSDQGEDVGETVLMTVSEEVCQSINSPSDHIQGIPLFDERQKSNNHIHQLAREVRQSLKEDKAPENGTLLTLPASYDVQLDPINPIYQLAKEIQQSLKEEGAAPENNTLLTVPASHDVQLDPTNPIYQLAKEVQQRLKEEEEAPEKNTLLTIPASHDVQLDPTNPIYQLAKEVQQSLKKEEAAPEKKTLLTVPASHDVQLEPLNPIYQLSEEVRQSMNGEEAQRNNPLLANTASDDVMLESVLIYQLAREVQQSLMDEKAPENETLPTIIDDSNDVQLESMNPIYQLAFEVCQGLKDEEAQENDTLLTTPFFDNVQLESTDQIFKLAKEVRQSLKIKEAPDNETPLATLATNDDAIPRLDYSNNFLVHHARDFSHHDSTNSPLISTVENSPSTTLILLENEADINIIQKLAREVEEEIERALRASPQKPLALFASSKQQDLNNDKQLSGKPTDEEQSHAASKSQNETIYSGDEVEELYHLKSEELEIQLNKLKKTTETSGSALPSSSGDSCRRGPLAATWRQSSFDVTCRPGYRGISHRATPTPSVKCVFRSGAKAPNKSSSIKRSLIGPLPPAYPGREYTRSGYRGR